jgi:hypothetical protein
MEVRFKNFVTIRGSYTQQGLSNHITFRPIKSGATVPLRFRFLQKSQKKTFHACVPLNGPNRILRSPLIPEIS